MMHILKHTRPHRRSLSINRNIWNRIKMGWQSTQQKDVECTPTSSPRADPNALFDKEMQMYMQGGAARENPFGAIAELRIRQAIQRGDFENLAKRGKPLSDEDLGVTFPFVDTVQFLTNRIMISQNGLPPFIEQSKMIDSDVERWRNRLEAYWLEVCDRDDETPQWLNLDMFKQTLHTINSRVNSYNMTLPTPVLPEKIPLLFHLETESVLKKHPPHPKHALRRRLIQQQQSDSRPNVW
jgi:hypothetical protein